MSFEPGGRADKLGNRYEDWWVAKQLLRVINEEVQSLTLEPVGPDEVGTEFWLKFQDSYREAHQCKARNADKDKWTVNELKHNGVLKNSKYQLDRDANHKFVFVSAVSNISLKDICDIAKRSSGPEDFYIYQIKSRGESVRKTFYDYCNAMELNPEKPQELASVYSYLKRTEVIHFVDDRNEFEEVLRFSERLFNSKPQKVLGLLFSYAIENNKLGKPITSNALIQYLKDHDIYPRNLALDTRIQPSIELLRTNYLDSIQPYLINEKLIKRTETKECLEALKEDGLIMLTGDSGAGKSSVLYELVTSLEEDSINYLPVRLDQQVPKGTAQKFGEDLGLPASPIHCIEGISKDESIVVIIDQLDSVRWTSSHSTNALAVCKELINQIIHFKREGRKISLVMACRSFDLKYDAELSKWFNGAKKERNFIWTEIKVTPLSEKQIREIIGQDYPLLNKQQQQLLMNPQNLHMWTELQTDKTEFISAVDLLRKFWETKFLAIEKEQIKRSDVNSVINQLVHHMEVKGTISAPLRHISSESELAKKALKSHGILLVQDNRVRFSHQSYLDYLIAGNIIKLIDEGESILDWIGHQQNQTLFRREQLRQALSMMIEEDSSDLNIVIADILHSESVRFHIKHLVLEVISHYNKIDADIKSILLDLLQNPSMKVHVLETIFLGNERATEILLDNNLIQSWVETGEDAAINLSINLLTSIKHAQQPKIRKVLTEIIELDNQWERVIVNSLDWDIENDSEDIFQLRLQLARKGIYSDFIDWKKTCHLSPIRVIKYIQSILQSIEPIEASAIQSDKLYRIDRWHDHDIKPLIKMAKDYCHEVWVHLFPEITRLYEHYDKNGFSMSDSTPYSITDGSIKLLIEAGKSMAKNDPQVFSEKMSSYKDNKLIYVQRIIIESFQEIEPHYSSIAIEWFLTKPDILRHNPIGWSRYKFARDFIRTVSVICSSDDFKKLEKFIIEFRKEDIVCLAQSVFDIRKEEGIYPHYWGEFQYMLLGELDQERISSHTNDLLKVLKRKFGGKSPESLANTTISRGGIVTSTIASNLHKISDNSWVSILNSDEIPSNNRSSWKSYTEDGSFVETSIGQYSNSLRTAAKQEPERFGRLGLEKLPLDLHASYLSSLISAVGLSESPNQDIEKWERAKSHTVIGLIKKYNKRLMDHDVAIEFCRLIRTRSDIDWPLSIIKLLEQIACEHPDPENNFINIQPAGWDKDVDSLSPNNLFNNSINCVRGVAADALMSLLFNKPQLFTTLTRAVESLVNDRHPSVRTGVIGTLLPVINIDPDQAVRWFAQAVSQDYRVMCTHYGAQFLNYTVRTHSQDIGEVLKKMIISEDESVVEFSSKMISGYHIIYGYYEEYTKELLEGNTLQKKGILQSAIQLIDDKEYANKCRELLLPIIDQYEPSLKDEMVKLLRVDIHEIEQNKDIIIRLIEPLYIEGMDSLIYNLDQYEGRITDFAEFIISVCKKINTIYEADSQKIPSRYNYISRRLFRLVLKLYEEAEHDNNRNILASCLDIYDAFYKNRIGTARELTNIIQ